MPQLKPTLALIAALSAFVLAGWAYHTHAENKRLGEALEQSQEALHTEQSLRAAERAVAERYARKLATLTTTQQATHARLQAATSASPTWSNERVPDAVATALGLPDTPETP